MTALAGNDNVAFSFTMKANSARNFTQAYYFLASNGARRIQYSDQHLVKAGSGNHYYKAYAEASKQGVSLGCKNNNNVNKSYTVAGYWDEETGGTIK